MIDLKKFSIIDVLIVLVVIFAIVFLGMKLVTSGANKGERKTVKYTVMVNAADAGTYDGICVGDVVCINREQDHDTATVLSVVKEPAKVSTVNTATGEHKIVTNADKEDVTIELETEVIVNDIGMKNGETAIKVGMDATVRGTGYTANGYIIKIAD